MADTGKTPEHYQIEDFVTDESFINYFFKLNSGDETFWNNWVELHPLHNAIAEAAKDMLRNLSLTLPEKEYQEEMSKIREAIHTEVPVSGMQRNELFIPSPGGNYPEKKAKKIRTWHLLAATLVIVAGVTFLVKNDTNRKDHLIEKYNHSSSPVVFTLSDGTVVTLAANGIFRYPTDFGNAERKVFLDGEAQFQVRRDEQHPFKVYAGDIVCTVLGTVFIVKKQQDDSVVLVELMKGKLKVETNDSVGNAQSVILNPDERVIYRGRGQQLNKEKWQSQNNSGAQINHLVFHQNSFEEIAVELKKNFGITVVNLSNKKSWRFTGEFKNTSAINILESISIVEQLKYEVRGDSVFVK